MAWCGTEKSKEGYGSTAICGLCVTPIVQHHEAHNDQTLKDEHIMLNDSGETNELEYLDMGKDESNVKIFSIAEYQTIKVDNVDIVFSAIRDILNNKRVASFYRTVFNEPPNVSINCIFVL
jgi:hypothetical protein